MARSSTSGDAAPGFRYRFGTNRCVRPIQIQRRDLGRRSFRLGEKDDQQNDDDDEQYSAPMYMRPPDWPRPRGPYLSGPVTSDTARDVGSGLSKWPAEMVASE